MFRFRKKLPRVTPSDPAIVSKVIDTFLSEDVKPYLQALGFTKQRRTFHKRHGDVVYVINFQGTHYNGLGGHQMFYVNCAAESLKLQATLGEPANPKPKEYECLWRARSNQVTSGPAKFVMAENYVITDLTEFRDTILYELKQIVTFFDQEIPGHEALMDLVIRKNYLSERTRICDYLAITDDTTRLVTYLTYLRDRFAATDDRWPLFVDIIKQHIGDLAQHEQIAALLEAD